MPLLPTPASIYTVSQPRRVLNCLVLALVACGSGTLNAQVVRSEQTAQPSQAACPVTFVDRAAAYGVDFVHDSGATGRKYLPETMGAGAAWIDYDGDGWSDLYLVQSGEFPPVPDTDGEQQASDRLFRNLGPDGSGEWQFEDVTNRAGIQQHGYGQGVLAWDFDGDRDLDLVVSHFGREILLENRAGKFIATALETKDSDADQVSRHWGSSMTAGDVDSDGDLDLYVARYLEFDPEHGGSCGTSDTDRVEYCDPSQFAGQPDQLWRKHTWRDRDGGCELVREWHVGDGSGAES